MLQVNPVVGVRHVPLEGALVALVGWKPPVACVSRPLGYLMPQNTFIQWDFVAGGDLVAAAEELANSAVNCGQPFIDRWSDWETFSSKVEESGLLSDHDRFIVLPIVAALNGDSRCAERLIEQELTRVGDSPDMYAKTYREYARRLKARSFAAPQSDKVPGQFRRSGVTMGDGGSLRLCHRETFPSAYPTAAICTLAVVIKLRCEGCSCGAQAHRMGRRPSRCYI
jgi:hypothetical protein